MIVNKLVYGLHKPEVGDIVVLKESDIDLRDTRVFICKRIVAVGGESVQIDDGHVRVDGKNRDIDLPIRAEEYPQASIAIDYAGHDKSPSLKHGVSEPYLVPKGHYFVLGDNRRYSADSRCYGAIPREKITGRVVKICWPPRRARVLR